MLSTDDYWYKNPEQEYKFNPARLGQAHSWNTDRCQEEMILGTPIIIIDNTNTTSVEWCPYSQMAEQYGYNVSFETPTSPWWTEIFPRIEDNTFTDEDVKVFVEKNTHGVPEHAIRRMMDRFTVVK